MKPIRGGVLIVIATILFALQIYCDFAGYSHIAIGAAQVMGFHLMSNFEQPYMALNIKDFWRRWHISLSTWLRDYIYIPLGGSRKGTIQKYRNIFITFLISGLWHGASWNYVVWGSLHGIYEIVGDITKNIRKKITTCLKINTTCFSYQLFQIGITFILVDFAWLFFRANSLKTALKMIWYTINNFQISNLFNGTIYTLGLNQEQMHQLFFAIVILLSVDILHRLGISIRCFLKKQNLVFRWLCYFIIVDYLFIGIIQDFGQKASEFIYFQF